MLSAGEALASGAVIEQAMTPIGVGVIGAGYRGPKHARTVAELPGASLRMMADLDSCRLVALRDRHPGVTLTTSVREVPESGEIEAVVIATACGDPRQLAGPQQGAGTDGGGQSPDGRIPRRADAGAAAYL
jgi:hypothetical protein